MSRPVRRSGINPNSGNALQRVVEMLRVWNGEGRDTDEAVLTRKELRRILDGGGAANLGSAFKQAIDRLSPTPSLRDLYPGTQRPTQPTDVSVVAVFSSVQIRWARPEYGGHARTEVYRNTEDILGDAVLVGASSGAMYADYDVEPGTTYYYWVRHVNVIGQQGPWNATAGLEATPLVETAYILEQLTGEITESHLYQSLNERINLIDGPQHLTGSVAQRVAAEADERRQAIAQEASDREQAISQAYQALMEYADNESAAATLVNQLVAQFGGDAAQALSFMVAEVDRSSATASSLEQLAVTVEGEDGEGGLSAAVQTHSEAIADIEDGVVAQWSVKSTVNDLTGGAGFFNDGGQVHFGVHATRFYISDPTAADGEFLPFIVDEGKVWINEAGIREASIDSAQIKFLAANKIQADNLAAISADLGHIDAGSININNRFQVNESGDVEIVGIAGGGGRMEIRNNVIKVFDENDQLRVQIGDLSA